MNEEIVAKRVRIVGENIESKVVYLSEALKIAQERKMDLLEITPNSDPPVCKVLDYKKYLFDQKKKAKQLKSKQQNVVIKELRFGPNTDEHDVDFKANHAIKFLQKGETVKAYVFFKGRSIVYKERGEMVLLKFIEAVQEYGTPKELPKMEGVKLIVFIQPNKKK